MDTITTAIIAALSKNAIKDSYNVLKAALKKKFGEKSDLVDAVDKLEKKPDSEGRKAMLQEEVEIAKVNDDPDIVKLAEELLKQLNSEESTTSKFKTEFQAEVKGAQVGDRNTQTNTFS
ncbi:MAG: hypothetical protein F6K10_43790 [Moorea sp. SIO2B7]|nr:hypothetical protein [Moorena sp. SIO2B7]